MAGAVAEDTPNRFMMNITRNQIAGIQEFFDGNDIQNMRSTR